MSNAGVFHQTKPKDQNGEDGLVAQTGTSFFAAKANAKLKGQMAISTNNPYALVRLIFLRGLTASVNRDP